LLTGDEFNGQQAYDWGMLTELCAPENLQQRARELALKVAAAAPLGVQAALNSSKTARLHGDSAALSEVFDAMSAVMSSEDAAEGVRSFMERRAAVFKGR
jgi:enoyl-CoA hydratase/carnithine racemase